MNWWHPPLRELMKRYGGRVVWVVGERVLKYPPDVFRLNGKEILDLTNELVVLNG